MKKNKKSKHESACSFLLSLRVAEDVDLYKVVYNRLLRISTNGPKLGVGAQLGDAAARMA